MRKLRCLLFATSFLWVTNGQQVVEVEDANKKASAAGSEAGAGMFSKQNSTCFPVYNNFFFVLFKT